MNRRLYAPVLLVAAILASCGGGDGVSRGGSCGVASCGGSVVGQWTITDSCVESTMNLSNICAGITASIAFSFSGGATYNADLTYTQTGSFTGLVHYVFPPACIGTQTCAQVQTTILMSGSAVGMGMSFNSATCQNASGGCACDATLTPASLAETGTYTTSANVLTTVHAGMTDTNSYCVSGNTMHQTSASATSTLNGSIVLTKS